MWLGLEERIEIQDPEVFTNPVKWVEFFIKINAKPVKLYKFQKKFLLLPPKDVVVVKARQLGMSWIIAVRALYRATHESGITSLLISLTHPQAIEFLRHAILAYNSMPEREYLTGTNNFVDKMRIIGRGGEPSKTVMEFENGSRIIALPNNPETVRGYRAHYVDWDETAKFPHEDDMIAALEPTTTRGGKVTYNSTHRGSQSRFYDVTQKVKQKHEDYVDYEYIEVPWTAMLEEDQNDQDVKAYLKTIEKFKREYGEKSFFFQEEYCCVASDESIAMFTHKMLEAAENLWKRNNCDYREPARKYPVYCGLDIGRVKDSTVLVAIEDAPEYAQTVGIWEWQGKSFPEQKVFINEQLKMLRPTFIRIDHKGIGADIAETFSSELGSQTQLMEFTPKEKEMMVLNTYTKMLDTKIAIPPDSDKFGAKLHAQLRNVRREVNAKSMTIRYVPSDESLHDDFQWAFCMAASLLITPTQGILMGSFGEKEKSTMVMDIATKEVKIDTEKKQPLQIGLTGAALMQADQKRRERDWRDFQLRREAPKNFDCSICVERKQLDTCPKELCKYSGQTPQMEKQSTKLQMADEYVCHRCWTSWIRVRK
mgnify:CR=1 FL=1